MVELINQLTDAFTFPSPSFHLIAQKNGIRTPRLNRFVKFGGQIRFKHLRVSSVSHSLNVNLAVKPHCQRDF